MTCSVCGKPASITVKDDIALCDACARAINKEIEANMEDK